MELTKNQKLYAELVNKAWEDAEFKQRLVENPIAVIEEMMGEKLNLPEGKRIVVRDQTDENKVFINIPAAQKNNENVELSEEQLEAVAGGGYPTITGTGLACGDCTGLGDIFTVQDDRNNR